jgi:hypothetical protein
MPFWWFDFFYFFIFLLLFLGGVLAHDQSGGKGGGGVRTFLEKFPRLQNENMLVLTNLNLMPNIVLEGESFKIYCFRVYF